MRVIPRSAMSGAAAASNPWATESSTAVRSVAEPTVARSRGLREVAETEPQHDGAADSIAVTHPPSEPIDDLSEDDVELRHRAVLPTEGSLRADGSAPPRGVHWARIAQPSQRVHVCPGRLAQQSLGGRGLELGELPHGTDAEPVQLLGRHRTDAPHPLDRQREEELLLAIRLDHEQPIGLADRTRDLGEELGACDADRDRQPDFRPHPLPQSHGDILRRARDLAEPAHLEERFVDRQSLDERRRVAENREHITTRGRVGIHPRRNDHGFRTQIPRLPATHRGTNSARLRLVAGREHDPAADDDRPPPQLRRIPLLDGCIERVEVGMQYGRLAPHPASYRSPA